jgi:hypothetical protein
MKIINPTPVIPSRLVASNVPEDDFPAWVGSTAYTTGQNRIYEHAIYEALGDHTSAITPDLDPTNWLRVGATNRWRMFDGSVDSGTSQAGTIEITITTGEITNGVALFNLLGTTLNVQIDDPVEGIVYDRDVLLQDNSAVTSWYAYFFEPIVQRTDVVLTDLPQYRGADINIKVDAGAGNAQIGEFVIGLVRQLGATNFGSSVSIQDYSRKERDQFGNTIVVERKFTKTADFDVTIETSQVFAVQNQLAKIRATPTVFIGDDARASTVIYGFFRQFQIVLDNPSISSCSIEVEGLA